MSNRFGISKVAASAALAGVLSLAPAFGGVASADTPNVSEISVTKVTDSTSPMLGGPDTRVFVDAADGTAASHDNEWKYVNVRRFYGPTDGTASNPNAIAMESIIIAHEGFD